MLSDACHQSAHYEPLLPAENSLNYGYEKLPVERKKPRPGQLPC